MANDQEEILLLPFFGQGHLFPCIELCKHLSKRNYKITLIISSSLTSSIPSSLTVDYPLIQIAELPSSGPHSPPRPSPEQVPSSTGPPIGHGSFRKQHEEMERGIESLLSNRPEGSRRPACAVIDVMMSRSKDSFAKFGVPAVSFLTSGACSAAMEYAMWKGKVSELKPGESRILPGLPNEMAVSYEEANAKPRDMPPGGPPPGGPGFPIGGPPPNGPSFSPIDIMPGAGPAGHFGNEGKFKGPPRSGGQPMWLQEIEGSVAILMNTCSELEGVFLDYVAAQLGIPVWGVGPLLPEQYWKSAGSILRDKDFRPKKNSSHSEEEVIQWLDSKPLGSVLYVSFGSEVGPKKDELVELASALEEMNTPFIWVVRPGSGRPGPPGAGPGSDQEGYYPQGLDTKVGERGLIIRGWAPQLLILSHPSTGGFLTHCGWNSTAEAIGRGVPFLAWPIGRDQYNNAKMVVNHLKIGYLVKETGSSDMVKKDEIVRGVEKLMGDVEVKRRAYLLKERFECGFPKSSEAALDAFKGFLGMTKAKSVIVSTSLVSLSEVSCTSEV